jgi:hypothetical protein
MPVPALDDATRRALVTGARLVAGARDLDEALAFAGQAAYR